MSDDSGLGKNVIIFDADMSLLRHIDKNKKGIFVFGKGSADGLHDSTLNVEKEYYGAAEEILFEFALKSGE